MNYNRTFHGKPALPIQRIIPHGELKCVYTGQVIPSHIVDGYNRYTEDFNDSSWRPTQEYMLDQRYRYIHNVMLEMHEKQERKQPNLETA